MIGLGLVVRVVAGVMVVPTVIRAQVHVAVHLATLAFLVGEVSQT